MNKTLITVLIVLALAVASYFILFGNEDVAQAPIVDEACQAGYTRLGEGCVTLKEACEAGGDQYYFDEAQQECLTR